MYNLTVLPDFAVTLTLSSEEEIGENQAPGIRIRLEDPMPGADEGFESHDKIGLRRRQFNRGVHQKWREDGWGN
jgi:phosphatidylserine/phosphatidylglycerophosphate/cardiolipin synthase-like enzyme